jgi:putative ABC transport system ATP-binding protein
MFGGLFLSSVPVFEKGARKRNARRGSSLIVLHAVNKSYREAGRQVQALTDVHLTIQAGEFVAIVGPSGSGKSTLLHLLGLLDRPTQGKYVFMGRDTGACSKRMLADLRSRNIGFVFQAFMLLPRMTVWENVELPLLYTRLSAGERKERVREALEAVGMLDLARQRALTLSGGQKQRAAIARAIVNRPELLLADEPTGNLDKHAKEEVLDIFRALHAQGKTVVMVTHDLEAARVAQRILQIRDGRLTEVARAGDREAGREESPCF